MHTMVKLNCYVNGDAVGYLKDNGECGRICLERFDCSAFTLSQDGYCLLFDFRDAEYKPGRTCGRVVKRTITYAEAQTGK